MRSLFSFLLILFSGSGFAQDIFSTHGNMDVVINMDPKLVSIASRTFPVQFKCKDVGDKDLIPDEWSDTIFYRVNYHFFKRKNGVGPYDSVTIKDAMILTDDFNYRFSNLNIRHVKASL